MEAQAKKGGARTLGLVIARRGGRWEAEVTGRHKASCELQRQLRQVAEASCVPLASAASFTNDGDDVVVGMVLFDGWRIVVDRASSAPAYALMQASLAKHCRRSGQVFVEHKVVAASALRQPVSRCGANAELCPMTVGRAMLAGLVSSRSEVVITAGERMGSAQRHR